MVKMNKQLQTYLIQFDDDDVFMERVGECIQEIRNRDLKSLYLNTIVGHIADTFHISDVDAELIYIEFHNR